MDVGDKLTNIGKGKEKEEYLYSAISTTHSLKALRHGSIDAICTQVIRYRWQGCTCSFNLTENPLIVSIVVLISNLMYRANKDVCFAPRKAADGVGGQ